MAPPLSGSQVDVMNVEEQNLVVFSYWAGYLPDVSELHFRSFRANNPGIRYLLHLDNSTIFHSSINSYLFQVLIDCDIEIVSYSLEKEMAALGVPPFAKPLPNKIQRIGRRIYKLSARIAQPLGKKLFPGLFFSEELGWTFWHKSRFSNLIGDRAYRSDIFRTIELVKAEGKNFLYSDIDIYFCRPLREMEMGESFTSQWGTSDFANSAFLFLSAANIKARVEVLKEITSGKPALPWILFTKEFCTHAGIKILPIEYFDPAWTVGSSIEGRSDLFFSNGPHVAGLLLEIVKRNWVVHWHNQWKSVPEHDSPYNLLLSQYR